MIYWLKKRRREVSQKAWRKILNFQCLLADCELLDLDFHGYQFTWCNKRENGDIIKERLDRALGNVMLREAFPKLQVFNIDPVGSDHHLLHVNFCHKMTQRVKNFVFEPIWCSHADFLLVVRSGWSRVGEASESNLLAFLSAMSKCRDTLLKWSKKEFPNNLRIIKDLKLKLAEITQDDVSGEKIRMRAEIEAEIDKVFEKEEHYWRQRSRVEWLKAGDRNSRFFHLSTIKRRHQNSILRLKNDLGDWLTEPRDIADNISSFFREVFLTSGHRDMAEVLNYVDPVIDDSANHHLMLPITMEEIKEAAFSLGGSKAPGPDGFSGKFYHSAWQEIGTSVYSLVVDFFAGKYPLHELNKTNITLIPKVPKPEYVTQFRPIGLCNFAYKIISKIIANRMKPYLDNCTSPSQSAFVPGRVIHDNIIIAHEVYHYLRRKKRSNKHEFALKIDMSKAYDRVEWDFLEQVLLKFGFCSDWVNLIMKCINSVTLNLCISGEKIDSFVPGRGLRQGDPLSPYLFILMSEVLSRMINKSILNKGLKGIKLSNNCPELSHIFSQMMLSFF